MFRTIFFIKRLSNYPEPVLKIMWLRNPICRFYRYSPAQFWDLAHPLPNIVYFKINHNKLFHNCDIIGVYCILLYLMCRYCKPDFDEARIRKYTRSLAHNFKWTPVAKPRPLFQAIQKLMNSSVASFSRYSKISRKNIYCFYCNFRRNCCLAFKKFLDYRTFSIIFAICIW